MLDEVQSPRASPASELRARSAPQLTVRAIVLAVVLACVLAAANAYLGLFAGMTIASAIPSAVVSMAVLRALGGGGILENNIVQTGGSAGQSVASGVIFTIPALVILGFWQSFHFWWVFAIAGLGGVLGVLFSVPLRRSLIIDQGLAFPEGKAAAEVLRTGENPAQGVKILGGAAIGGGLAKLAAASGLRLIPDVASLSGHIGPLLAYVGTNLSPAMLGVGYIVGFNIGVVVVLGSVISWNIAIPLYGALVVPHDPALAQAVAGLSAADAAGLIWSKQIRFLGVGAMLVGGVWTVIKLRSSLLSGIKSGLAARQAAARGDAVPETERDLPMRWILAGVVVFTIPLWLLYQQIVGSVLVSLPMALIMIVAGFLFCSVSAYMSGLIGSSNNPVSGITIATILFAAVVLLALMGRNAATGPVATIMIGAVVCCAASIAGDNLQDLKAGHLIGATPWKQQLMIAIGAAVCALVMAPVLNLLASAYGIGVPDALHPKPLLAPQATLMASVSKGLFGGSLPWNLVAIGAILGVAIIVLDEILSVRGSSFRTPVLAAAVGIYLPLDVTMPIFLGGLLAWLAQRTLQARAARGVSVPLEERERLNRHGTLFAAGMITGEALTGIVMAVPIVIFKSADALALPARWQFGQWLGVLLVGVLAWLLYRTATRTKDHAAR